MLVVVAAGLAFMAWSRVRTSRRRQVAAQARASAMATPVPPELIMAHEVGDGNDRVNILEKRIDEEVRARMQLEESVKQLQEELKVRAQAGSRAGRGGEGAA